MSPGPDDRHERARQRLAAHPWPAALRDAWARLGAGDAQVYLVGGTVRDVLLGRPVREPFDVATDLEPAAVVTRFERVEPIGLAHGTVLVIAGVRLECTTLRREGEYADARRPDRVTFTRDLAEDLARRDLTVNAMAYDPRAATLFDPFGGVADLEAGTLRAVGDPIARFREDALRPLRVARLAAVLEMAVEPATRDALGRVADRAAALAPERVRDELERLLAARRPSVGFELLRASGLLAVWLPELAPMVGVSQNRWHAFDVWTHTLRTVDAIDPALELRWAALLHDVGKPAARAGAEGAATFHGHERIGAEIADRLLERLRLPSARRAAIVHLVREHMFDYRPGWSDAALRRWLRRVGPAAVAPLFALRRADVQAKRDPGAVDPSLDAMQARLDVLLRAPRALAIADLAVDGRDVMAQLGIGPGPAVGAALEALLEAVLDDPSLNRRDALLARLATAPRERTAHGRDA